MSNLLDDRIPENNAQDFLNHAIRFTVFVINLFIFLLILAIYILWELLPKPDCYKNYPIALFFNVLVRNKRWEARFTVLNIKTSHMGDRNCFNISLQFLCLFVALAKIESISLRMLSFSAGQACALAFRVDLLKGVHLRVYLCKVWRGIF